MDEMQIYFQDKNSFGDVPENIMNKIKNTFTKYEVEHGPESLLTIKVPTKEVQILEDVHEAFRMIIAEVRKENGVLAGKLARQYGIR